MSREIKSLKSELGKSVKYYTRKFSYTPETSPRPLFDFRKYAQI